MRLIFEPSTGKLELVVADERQPGKWDAPMRPVTELRKTDLENLLSQTVPAVLIVSHNREPRIEPLR